MAKPKTVLESEPVTDANLETIKAAAALKHDAFIADIRLLASKPSDGSILRTLAFKVVGAGIAASERGEETYDARPIWEKEFCPYFYVGDRVKPKSDGRAGDQYGNAIHKLGVMGNLSRWTIDDRYRIARWIGEQKVPGESFMLPMPNMGSMANALMEKFDKTAPSDADLKKFADDKAKARRTSGDSSELKAASVVLANAIGKIGTAEDYDAVTAKDPEIGTLALTAAKHVNAYAVKVAAYFKALKDAEKANKPKTGKKGKKGSMTAAQRNAAANAKFAALLQPASDGSNGKGGTA